MFLGISQSPFVPGRKQPTATTAATAAGEFASLLNYIALSRRLAMQIHPSDRSKFLADWQESIEDRKALQDDPEGYTAVLTTRARQAYTQGLIDDEDLRELLEWADAAREWGVEATSYR
jgi:hypothetical protein